MTLDLALDQFTGTETYHRHPFFSKHIVWTDGVQYFIENAGNGAYWFLDILLTELAELHREHLFISITLSVTPQARAVIKATDGNETQLWSHQIDFTDCPVGDYRFFLTDNVILLTSEY